MGNALNAAPRQTKVVGDDWQFTFAATESGAAFNLTGYTPGGFLNGPMGFTPLSLAGMYNTPSLSTGAFVLTIPRSITTTFTPDDLAYRVQITLTDTYSIQQTYLIVPLCVLAS